MSTFACFLNRTPIHGRRHFGITPRQTTRRHVVRTMLLLRETAVARLRVARDSQVQEESATFCSRRSSWVAPRITNSTCLRQSRQPTLRRQPSTLTSFSSPGFAARPLSKKGHVQLPSNPARNHCSTESGPPGNNRNSESHIFLKTSRNHARNLNANTFRPNTALRQSALIRPMASTTASNTPAARSDAGGGNLPVGNSALPATGGLGGALGLATHHIDKADTVARRFGRVRIEHVAQRGGVLLRVRQTWYIFSWDAVSHSTGCASAFGQRHEFFFLANLRQTRLAKNPGAWSDLKSSRPHTLLRRVQR